MSPRQSTLPDPADLGLRADKFEGWREQQELAIWRTIESEKRFVVHAMPPGTGKSPMYMGLSVLMDSRSMFLTGTKGLQTQLLEDFGELLTDIRGQSNYRCVLDEYEKTGGEGGRKDGSEGDAQFFPKRTNASRRFVQSEGSGILMVDEGPCHAGVKCLLKENGCLYFDQVRRARRSKHVQSNYSWWFHSNKFDGNPVGKFELLVLDEAHAAADELSGFLAVEIEGWQLYKLGLKWPVGQIRKIRDKDWRDWAVQNKSHVAAKIQKLQDSIEQGEDAKKRGSEVKLLKRLSREFAKLAGSTGEWVGEEVGRDQMRWEPVWPAEYAEEFLFADTPKVVLVSATIRPKTMEYLGVSPDDYDFFDYAHPFPVKNRKVVHIPTVSMSRNTSDLELRTWVNRHDEIIGPRPDRKGIIHTVSFDRQKLLVLNSEFGHRMLVNKGGRDSDTQAVVRKFREMPPESGAILVSPSLSTGWDFPYDDARYQIISKVPFPYMQTEVMKIRGAMDPEYQNFLTVIELIQAAGRGTRSVDDWCETFLLDDSISWFWKPQKGRKYAPPWFIDALELWAQKIPVPRFVEKVG